ncbi:putative inhibitor of apoptosis [Haliotis rufescens]|uniref:putative inhibitor of apoptosis n=1 Tax=Haliotis rufescens TaxID=6454 RepID=UPI001EB0755F|nr:putative inhibitor of apoptosis [Haliotis rufescens]
MAERKSSTNTSEGSMVTEMTDACGSRFHLWTKSTDDCDDMSQPPPPPPPLSPSSKLTSPCHQSFESTVTAFEAWPMQMAQSAENMAHAGFVYVQSTDSVFCFHCSVWLRRWAAIDDPWVEHHKRSPRCAYLKLTGVVKQERGSYFLALSE